LGKGLNIAFISGIKKDRSTLIPISVIYKVALLEETAVDKVKMINLKTKHDENKFLKFGMIK
jgi:hypothetical protein